MLSLANLKLETPYSFLQLPSEIICHILGYLSVTDLLRIRQTSKTLELASRDRSVWFSILVSLSHSISMSTHSQRFFHAHITSDTAPAFEMEALASAHLRFRRITSAHQDAHEALSPVTTTIIDLKGFLSTQERLQNLRLVAGGRLMLIHTCTHVMLWDIGFGNPGTHKLLIQRALDLPWCPEPDDDAFLRYAFYTHQGEVRFCTVHYSWEKQESCISYFQIKTQSAEVTLERLGGFIHKYGTTVYVCSGTHVLFVYRDGFEQQWIGLHIVSEKATLLWKSGTTAPLHDMHFDDRSCRAILTSTLVPEESVAIYTIPIFPISQDAIISATVGRDGVAEYVIRHSPCALFKPEDSGFGRPMSSLWIAGWNIPASSPLVFESDLIIPEVDDSGGRTGVRVVRRFVRETESGEWTYGTRHSAVYKDLDWGDDDDKPYSMTLPDGWRFMWWEDGESESCIRIHTSSLDPGTEQENKKSIGRSLYGKPYGSTNRELAWQFYSFSPMTGRLCLLVPDTRQVKIMEYIDFSL
ncbi:hypothetical protein DL96DRAFT_1611402 [Flagelloscypha sp. PMI_526]|nr:hypothetical protein DL96DRAFT_1611402 [Flagelloscypha sp. PMI_526]